MALFNFGKKKEAQKTPACACNCGCPTSEMVEIKNECCGKSVDGICCIKVLGAGCPSCHQQYENAKAAVQNMGLDIKVEYITDMAKVMEYGVMSISSMNRYQKTIII